MAFLQNIPKKWISRACAASRKSRLGTVSEATVARVPEAGRRHHCGPVQPAARAQYIGAYPWAVVNTDTGDDRERSILDTKALSEVAFKVLLGFMTGQQLSPSFSSLWRPWAIALTS